MKSPRSKPTASNHPRAPHALASLYPSPPDYAQRPSPARIGCFFPSRSLAMYNYPSAAAGIAAALAERAEAVCRRYLPHGKRQGRYWLSGDLDGAPGKIALRPPAWPRHAWQMDRRSRREPWRPPRPHSPSHQRADTARSPRRGPHLPRPADFAPRGPYRHLRCNPSPAPPLAGLPPHQRHPC